MIKKDQSEIETDIQNVKYQICIGNEKNGKQK